MERKLIEYLPSFVGEYAEIREIMEAEQPEFDMAFSEAQRILDNSFILSANDHGLGRLESMIGLERKGTDTLEERRFKLLLRTNSKPIHTIYTLKEALDELLGVGEYELQIDYAENTVGCKLALSSKEKYQAAVKYLSDILPCNMVLDVKIMFNSNSVLRQMTHRNLSKYTHTKIRNEVLNG